jgi:hypothetical protein
MNITPKKGDWRQPPFTQADIDAEIEGQLPTNTEGDVSALDLRGVLHDMNAAAFQPLDSTSFADPTGIIGLTVVPGSATKALRSDGAPILSQAIAPTWTGLHTFNGGAIVPTRPPGDSSNNAASTAFVDSAIASSVPPFATPSALIGLTAVPGVGTNSMRADAAPAIDQSIAPTWTGSHTFKQPIWAPRNSAIGQGAPTSSYVLYCVNVNTDPTEALYGVYSLFEVTWNSNNSNPTYAGVSQHASTINSGAIIHGGIVGHQGVVELGGTGTADTTAGLQGYTYLTTAGTITNAIGVEGFVNNLVAGGTITNAYALKASSGSNGGTITNWYGLYVDTAPAATNAYGIYINGPTPSYFGGPINVVGQTVIGGTVSPSVFNLTVEGASDTSPTYGSGIFRVYATGTNSLNFGAYNVSPFGMYLQTNAGNYPLILQPEGSPSVGGGVAIGLSSSGTAMLAIGGNVVSTNPTTGSIVVTGGAGISGALNIGGIIDLPQTSSASVGVVNMAGIAFLHTYNTYQNLFLGQYAGNFSMTAQYCTGLGTSALQSLSSGDNNVGVGTLAGANTTSGTDNTAVGTFALQSNVTGYGNVAIGSRAMASGTGQNNISIGFESLYNMTTGNNNIVIGSSTGWGITTGSSNTIIGGAVQGLAANLSNSIILADGAGNIRLDYNKTLANAWTFDGPVTVPTMPPGDNSTNAASTAFVAAALAHVMGVSPP